VAIRRSSGSGDGDGKPLTIGNALGVQGESGAHFTVIKGGRVAKQDRQVLQGTDIEKDDAFEDFYFDPNKQDEKAKVLRPPYLPKHLSSLCQHNNTLGQMITTMEVNIDGTGWVIEKDDDTEDETEENDAEINRLTQWFAEPYPRMSFTTIRRAIRRDMEKIGYAYAEVLRAVDGTLTFLKYLPADQMRLVKLDEAVLVEETVKRDGEELKISMYKRERRFAQVQGKKIVYFAEYGASRDVDRNTGDWADKGSLPVADRATEVLFFKIHEDALTAYGVPRWVNNIPSVIGSRKAEELNLDFFNSGGLPPALIFIQGGQLTTEVRKQVQQYMSGKGSGYNRGGIVEVHSTGGTVDSPGNVRVTVERFGSERMQDSMFENYDARCEERVRGSFRLPPIFVGKSQDYSFATAYASYTVAEAQVFQPEREEFDEMINNTIMRELDPSGEYVYRSLPLSVKDVQTQLEALGMVADKLSDEGLIIAVNEAVGLSLKVDDSAAEEEEPDPNAFEPQMPNPVAVEGVPPSTPANPASPGGPAPTPVERSVTKWDTFELMELVNRWCHAMTTDEIDDKDIALMRSQIQRMDGNTRERFDGYAAMRMMGDALDFDLHGGVELVGAASEIAEHGADGCKH